MVDQTSGELRMQLAKYSDVALSTLRCLQMMDTMQQTLTQGGRIYDMDYKYAL